MVLLQIVEDAYEKNIISAKTRETIHQLVQQIDDEKELENKIIEQGLLTAAQIAQLRAESIRKND